MYSMTATLFSAAFLAVVSVAAAPVGDDVLIQLKSTSLALRKVNGSWNLVHFGERVSSFKDACALAWDRWTGYY